MLSTLCPAQSVRAFFHKNMDTCLDWLSRVRGYLVSIALHAGMSAVAVRHGFAALKDFSQVQKPSSSKMVQVWGGGGGIWRDIHVHVWGGGYGGHMVQAWGGGHMVQVWGGDLWCRYGGIYQPSYAHVHGHLIIHTCTQNSYHKCSVWGSVWLFNPCPPFFCLEP